MYPVIVYIVALIFSIALVIRMINYEIHYTRVKSKATVEEGGFSLLILLITVIMWGWLYYLEH